MNVLWIALLVTGQGKTGHATDAEIQQSLERAGGYLLARAQEPNVEPSLLLLALIPGEVTSVKDENWTPRSNIPPSLEKNLSPLLKRVLEGPLEGTAPAAWQALALERLHRARYQRRIARCAQFLVDSQCRDGGWGAGKRMEPVDFLAPPPGSREILLTKRQEGEACGDMMNSEWAAWAFQSAHLGGVLAPRETAERAVAYWRGLQNEDGGWGAGASAVQPTAAGTGSLSVHLCLLGRKWKEDPHVQAGTKWLSSKFTLGTTGPGLTPRLHSIKQAGLACITETFGEHRWYDEGARFLLQRQRADGSWEFDEGQAVRDTAYSMFFLRMPRAALGGPDWRNR